MMDVKNTKSAEEQQKQLEDEIELLAKNIAEKRERLKVLMDSSDVWDAKLAQSIFSYNKLFAYFLTKLDEYAGKEGTDSFFKCFQADYLPRIKSLPAWDEEKGAENEKGDKKKISSVEIERTIQLLEGHLSVLQHLLNEVYNQRHSAQQKLVEKMAFEAAFRRYGFQVNGERALFSQLFVFYFNQSANEEFNKKLDKFREDKKAIYTVRLKINKDLISDIRNKLDYLSGKIIENQEMKQLTEEMQKEKSFLAADVFRKRFPKLYKLYAMYECDESNHIKNKTLPRFDFKFNGYDGIMFYKILNDSCLKYNSQMVEYNDFLHMFNTYYKQRTQGISDVDRDNYEQMCDAISFYLDQVKRENKCKVSVPTIKNWKDETQHRVREWLKKDVHLLDKDIEECMEELKEISECSFAFFYNDKNDEKTNDAWDGKQAELQEEKERASAVILQAFYDVVEDEDIRERQRPLLKLYVGLRIEALGEFSQEQALEFLSEDEIIAYKQYEQTNLAVYKKYEQQDKYENKLIAGFLVEYTGRKPDTIRKDIKKFDKVMWKRVKNNFISKG